MPKIALIKSDILDVIEPDSSFETDLVEVPQQILDKYAKIMDQFYEVQNELEQFYRLYNERY